MNRTSIEWTDFTANPLKYHLADGQVVWGCAKVSAGCTHCYAEALAKRYRRGGPFNATEMAGLTPFLDEEELHRMRTYKPAAGKRVFVGDMTDVFGEWVTDDILDRLFAAFALRRDVTWQVLTKRPDRLRAYFADVPYRQEMVGIEAERISGASRHMLVLNEGDERSVPRWTLPLPNVWLGTSVEDQKSADVRIYELLRTPAAIRFISAEPLLGPVALYALRPGGPGGWLESPDDIRHLDWVIVGGESGTLARKCRADWVREVVSQCVFADTPVFVKQLGSHVVDRNDAGFEGDTPDGWPMDTTFETLTPENWQGAPVRVRLRSRKGSEPQEWPEILRLRQFPEVSA